MKRGSEFSWGSRCHVMGILNVTPDSFSGDGLGAGEGLIGRLVESNRIVVYDTFARNALKNKAYAEHENLTIIKGDVLDYESLARAMQGSDIVVHCAAIAGIDTVILPPAK